jgi:hypothetical protein
MARETQWSVAGETFNDGALCVLKHPGHKPADSRQKITAYLPHPEATSLHLQRQWICYFGIRDAWITGLI